MKQNSIEFLFEKLWDTPKDKFEWNAILNQAKEIHKQEIAGAYDRDVIDNKQNWFIGNGARYYKLYDEEKSGIENYTFEDGV
jgi:uncharacterized phage-like protein YoqJ